MSETWLPAGRVQVLPKGEYSSATTYNIGDIVTYNRFAFLCRQNNLIGVAPTNGTTTDYWQELTAQNDVVIATTETAGIVKPDGTSITVDPDGTIHGASTITIDSELSETSENPVQNKVINSSITELKADIDDSLYSEYAGGKNLIDTTLASTSINNVTATHNSDGSYTLSGKASATAVFTITESLKIPIGTYKLVGCPTTGGSSSTYKLDIVASGSVLVTDFGNGNIAQVTSAIDSASARIVVYNGVTINATFKPMLTADTNATYDDFEPYIGSNLLLCNSINNIASKWENSKSYTVGDCVEYDNIVYNCILNHTSSSSIVPTNTTYWETFTLSNTSKCSIKTSGSMHDITGSGVYFLGNSVTDKPTGTGGGTNGVLVLGGNGSVGAGFFMPYNMTGFYGLNYSSGTWTVKQLI